MKAEMTFDSLRLNQAEKVEKCLGKRDAASTHLHEVVSALRRIIKARKEKKDEAGDVWTKVKNL